MHTLGERLAAARFAVSEAEFEASRMLGPSAGVGGAASWAVWGETTGDLSVFADPSVVVPRLRKDVVLIGANFGTGGDGADFPPFKNFHAASSRGDSKLRNALSGTPLEGAFLTDLVKGYPTPYADGLAAEIASGDIDVAEHVVAGFAAEQRVLGIGLDTLYIPMGRSTRLLWDRLVGLGALPSDQRVFHRCYGGEARAGQGHPRVQQLAHYSAAVDLRAAVSALLAQPALPERDRSR